MFAFFRINFFQFFNFRFYNFPFHPEPDPHKCLLVSESSPDLRAIFLVQFRTKRLFEKSPSNTGRLRNWRNRQSSQVPKQVVFNNEETLRVLQILNSSKTILNRELLPYSCFRRLLSMYVCSKSLCLSWKTLNQGSQKLSTTVFRLIMYVCLKKVQNPSACHAFCN